MDPVREKLERARRDLLDLGLRNTLLNYTHLKTKGLRVVDELSAEIHRLLVLEGRAMSFLPAPERGGGDSQDVESLPELASLLAEVSREAEEEGVAARHRDTKLQTPYAPARLQRRLLNTYYAAKRSLDEQGVNILFLALGMLRWYEDESSQIERLAPLILIPVGLSRADVRSKFRVEYTGDEIDTNLSLQLKLTTEFSIEFPSLPGSDEDLDVDEYFSRVGHSVRRQLRWGVEPHDIALGFFSFSKLLMYKDLDESKWPENRKPTDHDVLTSILEDGFREPKPGPNEEPSLDDRIDPKNLHQVRDADSSQTLALLDVKAGRHLVIQGPPGTGKSQTITNVIADAIAEGKKVLFVSEKIAALDVVRRRLDDVELGDAGVEIHSHNTNKKTFLTELQRTLTLGRPRAKERRQSVEGLRQHRDRLNRYASAVNTPIGESGVTPHRAYGVLLRLADQLEGVSLPALDCNVVAGLSDNQYRECRSVVEELQSLLRRVGFPPEHPFWGSKRRVFLPMTDRPEIAEACKAASKGLERLEDLAAELAGGIGLKLAESFTELERLNATSETAVLAPDLTDVDVRSDAWVTKSDELAEAFATGRRIRELREAHKGNLIPGAWDADILAARRILASYGDKWWRIFSGTYRAARRSIRGLCAGEAPKAKRPEALLKIADAILETQRCGRWLEEATPLPNQLFGSRYKGWRSDWSTFEKIASYLHDVHGRIRGGDLAPELLKFLSDDFDRDALAQRREAVGDAEESYCSAVQAVLGLLEMEEALRFDGRGYRDVPFAGQESLLQQWWRRAPELQDIVKWNHLSEQMTDLGIGPVVDIAASWRHAKEHLVAAVDRARYGGLVEQALKERPELASFDGETHAHVVRSFRELDRALLGANRAYLAAKHWEGLPPRTGVGQVAVLRREFEKKRRHLPIRQLMERAGNAIQVIKPIFMMSPLSVAAYLPPGSVDFDLVVFDEASQVRPVDAFGAILRGRQTVVVGDSRQLPPTPFFDKIGELEEEEAWETSTSDLESILGLFCAQGAPERMLRWHYRSRHESLIAVSNHEFYDDRLFIFPSPYATREAIGLVFHYLPGAAYERGKAVNREEARIVAQAVMDHARTRHHLTLGVAAFSISQMQAVQDELELMRMKDPSSEGFFASHPEEPFFVKNLENVQGDERDVIFISVGYGHTEEGYLSMNFGPLNKDGGERRLNVLITRARQRCDVFSNLRAEDIDLSRTQARGVLAFKTFLKYGETGILDVPMPTEGEADSPFEEAVAKALRRHGFEVHHQVGSKGFFIDLAVVDAEKPGRYVVGIECDGASYHAARWARDRDRLRQEVLESLGWEIHRIWSTDWFRNPDRELRRVVERIEQAKARRGSAAPSPLHPSSQGGAPIQRVERQPTNPDARPRCAAYRQAALTVRLDGHGLHEVPRARLAEWIETVVRVESPVHVLEVASRIAAAAGVQRVGSRIRSAIDNAAGYAAQAGLIRRSDEFLWQPGMKTAPVRDRSGLDPASRKIELVAPEELEQAVLRIVEDSVGIEPGEAAAEACRLLGYQRVTDNLRAPFEQAIRRLLGKGHLRLDGGFLFLSR